MDTGLSQAHRLSRLTRKAAHRVLTVRPERTKALAGKVEPTADHIRVARALSADLADIIIFRVLAELADRHVVYHAAAQRADGFGAYRGLLSETRWTPRSSERPDWPRISALRPPDAPTARAV